VPVEVPVPLVLAAVEVIEPVDATMPSLPQPLAIRAAATIGKSREVLIRALALSATSSIHADLSRKRLGATAQPTTWTQRWGSLLRPAELALWSLTICDCFQIGLRWLPRWYIPAELHGSSNSSQLNFDFCAGRQTAPETCTSTLTPAEDLVA